MVKFSSYLPKMIILRLFYWCVFFIFIFFNCCCCCRSVDALLIFAVVIWKLTELYRWSIKFWSGSRASKIWRLQNRGALFLKIFVNLFIYSDFKLYKIKKDWYVQSVIVGDDCALPPPRGIAGRRGLAGTILVHKVIIFPQKSFFIY